MSHVEPLYAEWIEGRVGAEPGHRLMVVLAAPGCEWAAKTGGCTNCSFPESFGVGRPVSTAEYAGQIEAALGRIPAGYDGPVQLDLFVSGSLFNPEEVPARAQILLIERAAAAPGVRRIVAETRPEFVTPRVMADAVKAAGAATLEVAIGLESADRHIRLERINKGFSWRQFAKAAEVVAAAGAELLTYLLLKPLDTTEAEALDDIVESARRVFELGERLGLPSRVALEPCFVAPGTEVEAAFHAGRYRPPWLWSLVEAARRAVAMGPVQVGLSDEGLDPAMAARNCERCTDRVRAALAVFNVSQDPAGLAALDCACREEWAAQLANPS